MCSLQSSPLNFEINFWVFFHKSLSEIAFQIDINEAHQEIMVSPPPKKKKKKLWLDETLNKLFQDNFLKNIWAKSILFSELSNMKLMFNHGG